jgi:hypothetical protein
MSEVGRRLDRLAEALSPSQAIALYLDEVAASESALAHAQAMVEDAESAAPLGRLMRQVQHAARTAHHGEPKEDVAQAVRLVTRDVGFLYYVIVALNAGLLSERRLRAFQLLTITHELHRFVEAAGTPMVPGGRIALRDGMMARVGPLVCELRAGARLVDIISMRYFAGREIRFPDVAAMQRAEQRQLDELLGILRDVEEEQDVAEEPSRPANGAARRGQARHPKSARAQFDLQALGAEIASLAEQMMTSVVATAQAEALFLVGLRRQAWPLLARQLATTSPIGVSV